MGFTKRTSLLQNSLSLPHSLSFSSQPLQIPHQHLQNLQKLHSLLDHGHIIPARRFLNSFLFSKTPFFCSPTQLHTLISKPIFSDTLLYVVSSVPTTINDATHLYYSMVKDGFTPSIASVNRLLKTLASGKRFHQTLVVFSKIAGSGVRLDVGSYEKAVLAAVMLKDVDKGFGFMRSMEKEGLSPSVFVYNLVMGGFCKIRKIKNARKVFDEMFERKVVPNTISFNTMIDGYCKVGDIDEGFRLKERMKSEGVEANVVTYNSLLTGLCDSGRMEDVRNVLLEMEVNGFLPDGFSCVIFDDRQSEGDMKKAILTIEEMEERGLKPSSVTFNTLINKLCETDEMDEAERWITRMIEKASFSMNKLEDAYRFFDEMIKNGIDPTIVTFNTLINGLGRNGRLKEAEDLLLQMTSKVDQAETWVKRMIEDGVSPTVETYNSLIKGYGQMKHFVRCFEILEEMEKIGIKPNVISYGSLIHCLCKDHKLLDAEIVLADMAGHGVSPNAEVYNMVIEASCSMGKLKDAFRFFDEMKKNEIDPTLVTYNILINGLGRNGRLKKAEDLFLQMASKGLSPDVITYNSLILGYAQSGNTEKSLELYDDMKRVGIKPTIGTFHSLLYACRKDSVVTAEKFFQEMLQMDLIPDRVAYNEMIYCYAEEGNVSKAMSLHQQMVDQGVDADKVTYNCLILAYLRDRRASEVKHLVDDMKAKGLVPKADTYNILIKGHCDLKDFNGAYFWYREMFDWGMLLNANLCYQLISGLGEEGMLQEAQFVSSELSSRELNN
ncbi:unnamed protein product [Lupinus luteus]|uniref:Pentatricopeptide repeat-containing protein n=1 Tax=Lupinus luteus TaxID=3873 RepID=A0AAV1WN59_LUPLU